MRIGDVLLNRGQHSATFSVQINSRLPTMTPRITDAIFDEEYLREFEKALTIV
jgi:hypothetical protein